MPATAIGMFAGGGNFVAIKSVLWTGTKKAW